MRRDWWRFWVVRARWPSSVHRRAVSLTLRAGVREYTVGYRRKDWVE